MDQSCLSCQRVTDLLPAWYYNFRVAMVTWGEPPLSCCDSSAVSFVTGMWWGGRGLRSRRFLPGKQNHRALVALSSGGAPHLGGGLLWRRAAAALDLRRALH